MGNIRKKRVFQVAREFNVSHEALILYFKKLNYDISSRMSLVTEEMYKEVTEKYGKKIEMSEKDFDFKRKLKEKRIRDEAKKIEAQRDYEEKVRTSYLIINEKPKQKTKAKVKSVVVEVPPVEDTIKHVDSVVKPKEQPLKTSKQDKKTIKDTEKTETELVSQKKAAVKSKEDKTDVKKKIDKKEDIKEKLKKANIKSIAVDKSADKKDKLELDSKSKADKDQQGNTSEESSRRKRKKLKAKDRIAESKKTTKKVDDSDATKNARKKIKAEKGTVKTSPADDSKKKKFRKRSKKRKRIQVNEEEVARSIKETLAIMDESSKTKKHKKKIKIDDEDIPEDMNKLSIHEYISVAELAQEMDEESSAVIKKCLELGMMVSINQRLDEDIIMTVSDEFGFEVEILPELGSEKFEEIEDKDDEEFAVSRPPIVTIMGHVDHGKTSLLDYIRKSNIIEKESGGITQHIGAYSVNLRNKNITFLDTPGHEAFAAMRARGAQATDIVILVVAADDNVMPQTKEAISHAKAANVPIIIAINKIDKSNANIELIKKQLADYDVLIESWGGKYQAIEISALTGENVEKLLDCILIESEMLELKANPNRLARGIVIESRLDKGKGVLASILVQKGQLMVGHPFVAGQFSGKVRSLYTDRGKKIKSAGPSTPVQVMGFSGLPQAGDTFVVLETEKDTKEISSKRQQIKREHDFRQMKHLTLDEISRRIKEGQVKELSIIIKGDVDGSVEAISDSLIKLSNDEVAVKVIHKGVGAISESDVLLASTSAAIIIGFQVRSTIKARDIAKQENVDIRLYNVIYNAISDVRDALEGLLDPDFEEDNLSVTEVRDVFRVPKIGQVAGCYIVSGKVTRNDKAKLFRNDKLIFEGKISTLKRFKDDAKEVMSGFECGMTMGSYDDYKVGDIIETYKLTEIKRTLATSKQ